MFFSFYILFSNMHNLNLGPNNIADSKVVYCYLVRTGKHCSWSRDGKNLQSQLLWQVWKDCSYHETRFSGSIITRTVLYICIYNCHICCCILIFFLLLIVKIFVMGQNTNAVNEQILYLVYCMENAILNLNPDQEQMVWLISFQRWNSSNISLKVTRETAKVLQNHYPERLGLGILYDPPKIFESFWTVCIFIFSCRLFISMIFINYYH